MRRLTRRGVLLALFVGLWCLPALAGAADLKSRLDGVIDYALGNEYVVGTVVLVARDGKILYRRAAGYADREAGTPMAENAIFRLASMTKPIVSATVLALADAGKLTLDDPVTRWIADFRPALVDGTMPDITLRHLLTHTAGLSYGFLEPHDGPLRRAGVSDGLDQTVPTIEENLRRLAGVTLLFKPGTQWSYSLATDVLGEVAARAGGAPLPEVVARYVTNPLRLSDTGFAVADAKRLAVPYVDARPRPHRMRDPEVFPFAVSALIYSPARIHNPGVFPSGGAGMVGSAGDYLRFVEALRLGGAPILKGQSTRAMTRNAVGDLKVPLGGREGWGFGLGVSVLKSARAAGDRSHDGTWGWGGVYGTSFFVDPAARLSVVVMTNTAVVGTGGPYVDAIQAAVYDGLDSR
jgi:CubicO group peptidase (beta-lactamase class C family)